MLDAAPLTNRTLGDFTVGEKLGEGGYGVVYRAEQRTLGREAVIKVLHARHGTDEALVKRFLREAQLASRLDHPFAAHIYAFGAEPDGLLWIAMELVRGTTLRKVLDAQPGGRLPLARLVPLLDGLCEVVHTAHEQGIVHRDLKPDNVMVLSRAGRLLPKLLDLGVAKLVTAIPPASIEPSPSPPRLAAEPSAATVSPDAPSSSAPPFDAFTQTADLAASPTTAALPRDGRPVAYPVTSPVGDSARESAPSERIDARVTQAGAIVGSPHYMAPEQWIDGAPIDARADQYALGVVAFEMVAGMLPFTGSSLPAIARAHLQDAMPGLPDGAPPALAETLSRALAKRPEDRFPTVLAFAEAVRAAAGLRISPEALPRLDDDLRAELAWLPQPIADAIAELEAARNPHQARDALWQIVRVIARWLGLLALCARSRTGARGGDSPAVSAALRELHRRDLTDDEWLDLVRALARPFADIRDAYPIPELIDLALAEPSPFQPLLALRAAEGSALPPASPTITPTGSFTPTGPLAPTGPPTPSPINSTIPSATRNAIGASTTLVSTSPSTTLSPHTTVGAHSSLTAPSRMSPISEESLRDHLARTLPVLAPLLRAVAFLGWYQVIVPRGTARTDRAVPADRADRADVWMGPRRSARPVIAIPQDLPPDEPVLADLDGRPVLQLAPLIQVAAPSPSAPNELFLFAGAGRIREHGARLVAEPHGFERHDDQVWAWFRANLLAVNDASGAATEQAPYRGLAAFTEADAATFFGRERAVEGFVNQLLEQPLLAVVGPSGTGKSSFVRAGVIPALPTGWRAVVVRPGAEPMLALAARLGRSSDPVAAPGLAAPGLAAPELAAPELAAPGLAAPGLAAPELTAVGLATPGLSAPELAAAGETVVLVVDQLEELFTLCRDPGERDRFATELARLARSAEDRTRVVVTLRDDFLARTAELAPLRDRLARAVTLLATPAEDDLLRVLVEPARRAGYDFDDGLATRMVDAVAGRPGALALLSFTALRLWELRDRHFKRLTAHAYDAIGGVEGALARHAEDTLQACTAEEQRLVREAFRHLVTAEGTRATLTRSELAQVLGASPAAQAAINRLIDARLVVVAEDDAGDHRIEIIHEALLVAWPRLVDWRRDDAEGARLRDQLRAAARQWNDRGRPRGLLWRDDALDDYVRWRARWSAALPDLDQAFGDASVRDAARGRRTRRALAVSATAILAAGVVALSLLYRSSQHSAEVANTALIDSLIQQGQKELFAGDYLRALPFLAQAYRAGDRSIAVRAMLHRAIKLADQPTVRMHGETRDARLRPGDREVMVIGYEGDAAVVDATTGRVFARLEGPPGVPGRSFGGAISDDGALAALVRESSIAIWDGVTSRSLAVGSRVVLATAIPAFDSNHGRLAVADGHVVTMWNLAEGTLQWSQPVPGRVFQTIVIGDHVVVTSLELSSVADRQAWLVSAQRVVPLGPALLVAAIDAAQFVTIEPARATRRSTTGSVELAYEIGNISAFAISSDGKRIAFGLASGVIELVETGTARRIGFLAGHRSFVQTMAFTPDGKRLVSMASDRTVRIWDVKRSRELFSFVGLDGTPRALQIAAHAKRMLAATSELLHLFPVDDPSAELVIALDEIVGAASFVAGGTRILTTSESGVELWDAATGNRLEFIPANVNNGVHASPDLRFVAIPRGDVFDIEIRELHGGSLHATLHSTSVFTWAVFDHKGARIATANGAGLVELWNPDGAKLATLHGHAPTVLQDVEFSPDDRLLLSASNDLTARLWDIASGTELGRVTHKDAIDAACFDSTGTRFATASEDKSAILWDVASRQPIRVFPHESLVRSVALDARFLGGATVSGLIQLWDLASGREAARFKHAGAAQAIELDGDRLLTTAYDGRIVLWDVSPSVGTPEQVVAFTCSTVNESDVATRDKLQCARGELPQSR